MATSSSMRYSVVQADEELLQQTLGIYTKGAMFWGKQSGTFKGDMTVMDALPGNYVITIIGCNSGSKSSVQAILTEISNWLNTNVLDKDNLKITDFIDVPAIVRLNASYTAKEFSFKFADARGRIYTLTVSPIIYPKAGELISKECEDKDQWGIFTDGSGGSYRQLLKANSTNCGYVPPEPAGIEKRRFCEDFDQWGEYTDGNYGTYTQLIKTNSTACGYVPPPPAGTLIDTVCEGTTKWGNFTDGAGGTRRELMAENSPDCGYVAPPPGGEPSGTYCQGLDLWGKYTDGAGGFTNQLIKENSPDCGFTGPEPAGQLISTYCVGKDKWGKYTDGNGGFTNQVITVNHVDCGGGSTGGGGGGSGTVVRKQIRVQSWKGEPLGYAELVYDSAEPYFRVSGLSYLPGRIEGTVGANTWVYANALPGVFMSNSYGGGIFPDNNARGADNNVYPYFSTNEGGSIYYMIQMVPLALAQSSDIYLSLNVYPPDQGGG